MQELLYGMMLWVGASTAYNVDIPLPNIAFTEPGNICANYGIQQKHQCEASGLVGYYNRHHTILFTSLTALILATLQTRRV